MSARQHPVGAHALLADGRTAALIDPDGDVAWLCWPRVDSDPCLFGILDAERGGTFSVRPAGEACLSARRYQADTLVLHSEWTGPRVHLEVDDALAWGGPVRLVRVMTARDHPVDVEVRFSPSHRTGRGRPRLSVDADVCVAGSGDARLAARAPVRWRLAAGAAVATVQVSPARPLAVTLQDATAPAAEAGPLLKATTAHWRRLAAAVDVSAAAGGSLGGRVLGVADAARLLRHSALVMLGLCQRGGGMVAAPTTSLPQWPGSSRTWDYRYAWMRDNALAGLALLRVGLIDEARGLADFCGQACHGGAAPVLLRVDGGAPPPESELGHLSGHGGARPVRIGNAAAAQAQVDVLGELVQLAAALDRVGALPDSLRQATPHLATAAAVRWREPDHGIWEIRGEPRHYTHSRLLAWSGLRDAAALARRDSVAGDAAAWEQQAAEVRETLLRDHVAGSGALTLHDGGGGPDAALALIALLGLLDTDDPRVTATLDSISERLARGGLVDRHLGTLDGIRDPCAPFVFPTFWLAAALERCGRDGSAPFAAALRSRSPLDLFAEVADPDTGTPLGNYPQAQSHASFILAATCPRRGER